MPENGEVSLLETSSMSFVQRALLCVASFAVVPACSGLRRSSSLLVRRRRFGLIDHEDR